MANFTNISGKGKWDAAHNTLTIAVGEAGGLILEWGTGPDGASLVISPENPHLLSNYRIVSGPRNGDRTIQFLGGAAGTATIRALVASNRAAEYAQAVSVVILPRRESSIGWEHVEFWGSNADDEERFATESNQRAVERGGVAYNIRGYEHLLEVLALFRDSGRRISQLTFNTHGNAGYITFRKGNGLTVAHLELFKGKGFERIFPRGARVFFHGCRVAAGQAGETFLTEFGKVFLCGGGGSVAGSTSTGWGMGGVGGSGIYHIGGETVRVYIAAGGTLEKVERTNDVWG